MKIKKEHKEYIICSQILFKLNSSHLAPGALQISDLGPDTNTRL